MERRDWEFRREIALPFELPLADGRILRCEALLRILPGRRLVCRGRLGRKPVLAKLFMGRAAAAEAAADAAAIRAMMAAGIATPALRQETRVEGRPYPVLLFDFLARARSFRQAWQEAGPAERARLLRTLLRLVARQHRAGLRQRDFHLNNFLLDRQGGLHAIDGGDFLLGRRPVGRRAALADLGLLFAHLPRGELHRDPGVLDPYLEERGWASSSAYMRRLRRRADRLRHRRARRIARKGFRSCSEFLARRRGRLRICQRRDLPAKALDRWLDETALAPLAGEPLLKAGNSQTVWKSRLDGREVVVKRYNLKNFSKSLRRALGRSRAARSWENALRLRAYHIATPEPLAMIEERAGPFRRRAWLITAVGRGEGAERFLSRRADGASLERLAETVLAFGDNGLVHGDMKASNFLMDEKGVEVIDLDAMRRPLNPLLRRAAIRRERRRFLRNWQGELGARFRTLLGV